MFCCCVCLYSNFVGREPFSITYQLLKFKCIPDKSNIKATQVWIGVQPFFSMESSLVCGSFEKSNLPTLPPKPPMSRSANETRPRLRSLARFRGRSSPGRTTMTSRWATLLACTGSSRGHSSSAAEIKEWWLVMTGCYSCYSVLICQYLIGLKLDEH